MEETHTIERAIEARVQDFLSGIISQDKYAVYVQVTATPDPKLMQQYFDDISMAALPGLAGMDANMTTQANLKLFSLVKSKRIMVVFDKSVTDEQEGIAKEVLTSKLAIDTKAGDSLLFRKTSVPSATDRAIASVPSSAPTAPSWIKTALIALGIALALAIMVMLWQVSILRERVNSRAKLSADVAIDQSSSKSENSSSNSKSSASGNAGDGEDAEDTSSQGKKKKIKDAEPISVGEIKEKILSLAVANPKSCSTVARKLLATREGMRKLAVASEAIGFEYTKQLFDTVSPDKWRAMGEYLRSNLAEVASAPVGEILMEIYTDMLAESMGWDPSKGSEGPFDFLHKLNGAELNKMFADEEPTHIAFIAAFWAPEEMAQILNVLPDRKRKETVLNIARLRNLPKEVVEQAAIRFADRLKAVRSRNEVDVDGSEVISKMLSLLDGSAEEEILKFIEQEDPEARNRLRSHYFDFDSIQFVPTDILTQVFESGEVDPGTITKALVGAKDEIIQRVLNVLPSKQRGIVEDDVRLANQTNNTPKNDIMEGRKLLVSLIHKEIQNRGIVLADMIEKAKNEPAPDQPPAEQSAAEVLADVTMTDVAAIQTTDDENKAA
jgi:flagellar motor switch protein FliG